MVQCYMLELYSVHITSIEKIKELSPELDPSDRHSIEEYLPICRENGKMHSYREISHYLGSTSEMVRKDDINMWQIRVFLTE